MIQVSVTISGSQEAIAKLRHLDISLLNFSDAMRDIGDELKSYYSGQVFASQGGAIGVVWPTLAAKTVLYKLKHYPQYASTPLIRTGTMKGSFTSDVTPNSVTIGNRVPYFKYHQSSEPRTKIPYRPMMAVNEDVKNIIQKIVKADISRKVESL